MRISVLNLDRSPDRLASFLAFNAHLTDLHRIAAVDGNHHSREDLQALGLLDGNMPGYTNGAIGNALSHLDQWEVASKGSEILTVAEDDAVFHWQFEDLAQNTLARLPPNWDIVLWGWNFDSILAFDLLPGVSPCIGVFDQNSLRANLSRYQKLPLAPTPHRLYRAFGTVCHSVSPAGATKLLSGCLPIRPMTTYYPLMNQSLPNTSLDCMLNELYPEIQAYVCVPPLAVTPNDHAVSTVRTDLQTNSHPS